MMRMAAGLQSEPRFACVRRSDLRRDVGRGAQYGRSGGGSRRCWRGAGFDPEAMLALAQSDAAKDRLKTATEDAIARGAFGAPTFFVGDQMFFGQDRLDWVEEAVAA